MVCYISFYIMWLIQREHQIVCSCGSDTFISMGDDFGFTMVECVTCANKNSIMDSAVSAKRLPSPKGEEHCTVFGKVVSNASVFEDGIVSVDYLLFTQFDTAVMVSAIHRHNKILLAKEDAIENERYERAAVLRKEEQITSCVLIRERYSHMQL